MTIPVHWFDAARILTMPARLPVGRALARIESERPNWVVIRRPVSFTPEVFYYALRPHELGQLVEDTVKGLGRTLKDVLDWTLEEALNLRETKGSTATRGERPDSVDLRGIEGPASLRAVHLNAAGEVTAIGEPPRAAAARPPSAPAPPPSPSMQPSRPGPKRSARPRGTAPAPVNITISAEAPEQAQIGSVIPVDFRLDLAGEGAPLRERIAAAVKAGKDIRVILTTSGGALKAVGPRIQAVQPPSAGKPVQGVFEVRAVEAGAAELALLFRQGGTELGSIRLAIEVVHGAPKSGKTSGLAPAAPRTPEDDDLLVLLIQQETEQVVIQDAGQPTRDVVTNVYYEYQLQSDELEFNYLTLRSRSLQDRGGGAARTAQAYVERIYDRVTQDVLSPEDMQRLERQVGALGAAMCAELFDPEVTRKLWPVRSKLRTIQVTSWEPYIPWELVRLKHPDTSEVDDRFLCEYGLVRSLPGECAPRALRFKDWAYLAATYPNGTAESVAGEVDYFTKTLPSRGIHPVPIAATYLGFLDALETPEFDVLHLACHGESQHQRIDEAVLQIGDELDANGQPRLVEMDTTTVKETAKLRRRRPLVFLNACESGRHGPSLTAWGGWPTAFLGAGAGAFVGTSWPVRDVPASKFAHAFYDALQKGETLSAAATAARLATKGEGDASWLAFKVYGHPCARQVMA